MNWDLYGDKKMNTVMFASVLIPIFVAVTSLVVGRIFMWRAFRKTNRLNLGWEKLYNKLLRDGWIPPPQTKWFVSYMDVNHPEFNSKKCWIAVVEEE
jgi:hypothetical protein